MRPQDHKGETTRSQGCDQETTRTRPPDHAMQLSGHHRLITICVLIARQCFMSHQLKLREN